MALARPKRLQTQSAAHSRSPNQEAEIAKRLGGRVQKGSGSGAYQKADVKVEGLVLVEAKTTQYKSFRVTTEMIEKLEGHSFGAKTVPAIAVELELGKHRVYVIPDWVIEGILGIKVDASAKRD